MIRMDHINTALGRGVGEAINEAGLSLRQVADMTGIPYPTLHRKVRGQGRAGFDVIELHRIASATKRPMGSLIPAELLA